MVFFWHGQDFVGTDRHDAGEGIIALSSPGAATFIVRYEHWGPKDGHCCPSLPVVDVRYHWDGKRFAVQGRPPSDGYSLWGPIVMETPGMPTITPLPTSTPWPTPPPLPTDTPGPVETCAVQRTGYNASVVISGSNANAVCAGLVDRANMDLTDPQQAETMDLVCHYREPSGRYWQVFDIGAHIIGNELCNNIQTWINQQWSNSTS